MRDCAVGSSIGDESCISKLGGVSCSIMEEGSVTSGISSTVGSGNNGGVGLESLVNLRESGGITSSVSI